MVSTLQRLPDKNGEVLSRMSNVQLQMANEGQMSPIELAECLEKWPLVFPMFKNSLKGEVNGFIAPMQVGYNTDTSEEIFFCLE